MAYPAITLSFLLSHKALGSPSSRARSLVMAFLFNRSTLPQLRSYSQKVDNSLRQSKRGVHIEAGAREKALLAPDCALDRFKSHKKSVWRLKRIGDVLTVVVVAGCCYEIYVKAVMREEAQKQAGGSKQ